MSIINKILELLQEQGKSQADICKYLGIKQNVFTTWKKRGTDPPAKLIAQICEFFDISLECLLKEDETKEEKIKVNIDKNNINMGNNNTYTTGKIVTVNNIISSNSESMKKNQKYNDKYDNIIMCLDSMEEKNKRHAIVDIEYMLEKEYEFIRTADKQSESSNYNRIIEYLDSLDEKKCRHAIVDVEYILETQYNFKKKQ